ncbi:DUF1653 domain-containing protein [Trichlorobacter lovleyi]|uniref:DUF1653 domain-containing protein n=1 Tax=Trichlorobacter lovleyi TaxID=313985 RepID=UPI002240C68C|nr:DUF1653 domain-containing protein [Trichlorobacter lovleyi]
MENHQGGRPDADLMKLPEPLPGRYRHYKGGEYEVVGTARHSESDEQLVVYRCLYDNNSLWVRPLAMFLETVPVDGRELPRFERIRAELPG